jgi:N utilization substance protein B
MKTRRDAREWAMQVLYALEFSGHSLEQVTEQLHPQDAREPLLKFAHELADRTEQFREPLDQAIKEHADKWDLERIALLDRIILRMAICEILHFSDIPPRVSINEAIEIAKKYSTEKSDKFINGILDAVLHQHTLGGEHTSKSKKHKKQSEEKATDRSS